MRSLVRSLSTVLITAGVLLLIDAGLTFAWQEPVSAVYAHFQQRQLSTRLDQIERRPPTRLERRALAQIDTDRRRVVLLARQLGRRASAGTPIGRIRIPHIHASYVVVQGTDTDSLQKGPGHYPGQPMPGEPGTVAIAGHRTTYLAPFRNIDDLRRGDQIVLEMPYARVVYRVERHRIVMPTDLGVLRVRHGANGATINQLVLTACHPLYSAARRFVVFARQASVEPRGAALIDGS